MLSPKLLTPDQVDRFAREWRLCYTRGVIPEAIALGDVVVTIKAEERDRRRVVFGHRRQSKAQRRASLAAARPSAPSAGLKIGRVPGQWWTK